MPDRDEQRLIATIRRQLDADAEHLDARARLRLERARRKALSPPTRRPMAGWRPLAVTVVLALLLVGVWQRTEQAPSSSVTAASQASATVFEEQGELIADDMEFYAWLGGLPASEQTAQ